ncbi:hypothetical protein [Sorangium cellulosum]|uniref:hypothetical protein n=1 Tax=Sorangium cellulosum TaxID=56 RepID=UPI001331C0AA|nr:hypothetical protein [Sorangium cellulosum]
MNVHSTTTLRLCPLTYDAEGKIVQVSATKGTVAQRKSVDALARMEAETMVAQRGVEVDVVEDDGERAGVAVAWIDDQEVLLGGCEGFTDTPGERIGVCAVSPTGGWQAWTDVECPSRTTPGRGGADHC